MQRVFYWITAILYGLLILLVTLSGPPVLNWLDNGGFSHAILFASFGILAAWVLQAAWKKKRGLTPRGFFALIGIAGVYVFFYFRLSVVFEEIHLVYFAGAAILFQRAFRNSSVPGNAYGNAILAATAISGLDEYLQSFMPGRFAEWHDVGLGLLGSVLGAALAWIFNSPDEESDD